MSSTAARELLLNEEESKKYRTLLEISHAIASHTNLEDLLHALAEGVHPVVDFDFLNVMLHDPERNVMRVHVLESRAAFPVKPGMEFGVEESVAGIVWQTQQPLIINDTERETRFSTVCGLIRAHGVRSCYCVPLTTPRKRLGSLNFGSSQAGAYSAADFDILQLLAT